MEPKKTADARGQAAERFRLALLICCHITISCVSLIYVADNDPPVAFDPVVFHLFFDISRLHLAVAAVAAFSVFSAFFLFVRFSFAYFVGFYFYSMILGYLWLNTFSDLNYDHDRAGLSAAASAIAFLLSALFVAPRIPRIYTLSEHGFDRLLIFILVLAAGTAAIGAMYNFRLVALTKIYDFRNFLESPKLLNYLTGMVLSALLPFAFAGFVARKAHWKAGAALLLHLFFYPVTLSKLPLFAPLWMAALLLLSAVFHARTVVVLSLSVPVLIGVILHITFPFSTAMYFSTVNLRLMTIPSNAMDLYNDYFSRHDLTYFCQIPAIKRIISCPYQEPLWIIMEKTYKLGNLNASLFATEGVASVGLLWAPLSALGCGLIIAFGSRMADGLPQRFVLLSGAVLPLVLLNVPLSIVLVTHGASILFLLWYITPRSAFQEEKPASA